MERVERITVGLEKYKGLCIGGPEQGFVRESYSAMLEVRERDGMGGPGYVRNLYYFCPIDKADLYDESHTGVWVHESIDPDGIFAYLLKYFARIY